MLYSVLLSWLLLCYVLHAGLMTMITSSASPAAATCNSPCPLKTHLLPADAARDAAGGGAAAGVQPGGAAAAVAGANSCLPGCLCCALVWGSGQDELYCPVSIYCLHGLGRSLHAAPIPVSVTLSPPLLRCRVMRWRGRPTAATWGTMRRRGWRAMCGCASRTTSSWPEHRGAGDSGSLAGPCQPSGNWAHLFCSVRFRRSQGTRCQLACPACRTIPCGLSKCGFCNALECTACLSLKCLLSLVNSLQAPPSALDTLHHLRHAVQHPRLAAVVGWAPIRPATRR